MDRKITAETRAIIQKLSQAGKKAGVCTGRHYSTLFQHILPLFPDDAVHVTCGGAQIITSDGKVLWETFIPAEISKKIFNEAERRGFGIDIPNGTRAYANQHMIEVYGDADHLKDVLTPIDQLPDWAASCIVITGIDDDMLVWLDDHIGGITVKEGVSSRSSRYIDITPAGITKAAGLKEWSVLTGIPLTKVMGFGDGNNDLEFLSEVGWSVAMENGTDELKENADRVIGHADQDGLAIYLEALLKGAAV
jgi:Cof subfamily protein (haloacid dehalogenase superfamily)